MNIKKENNELVLRLPLLQPSFDAVGKQLNDVDNLIGVIAGNDYSISQLIDLAYKGDQQEGMPIVMFESKEELEKVCKTFNINIWEHRVICECCKNIIRGSFEYDEKGPRCYNCEKHE
jgi:hypothetical protein